MIFSVHKAEYVTERKEQGYRNEFIVNRRGSGRRGNGKCAFHGFNDCRMVCHYLFSDDTSAEEGAEKEGCFGKFRCSRRQHSYNKRILRDCH